MDFSENVYVCIEESAAAPAATLVPLLLKAAPDTAGSASKNTGSENTPEHISQQKKPGTKTKKKRRRRRKLDMAKTLARYRSRILGGPLLHDLHQLDNCYLSTFQIFSTEKNVRKLHTNNAFVLMDICRGQGYCVHGVTSECKVGGEYRAPLLEDHTRENSKVVYVGNYNYFTQHPESKWSLKPPDKVYSGYV